MKQRRNRLTRAGVNRNDASRLNIPRKFLTTKKKKNVRVDDDDDTRRPSLTELIGGWRANEMNGKLYEERIYNRKDSINVRDCPLINDAESRRTQSTAVRDSASTFSPFRDDSDCEADDEQETDDRPSEGARLYSKLKRDLDLERGGIFGYRPEERPIPLACVIFIIKGLLPAIKSAALTHKQSADEHERKNAAYGLMYAFDKFNDDYIEQDRRHMISLCHSPEARNVLDETLRLLEECMTVPFQGMGVERGLYIISALIKPEVRMKLVHLAEILLYDFHEVEKLKGKRTALDAGKNERDAEAEIYHDFEALSDENCDTIERQQKNGGEHNLRTIQQRHLLKDNTSCDLGSSSQGDKISFDLKEHPQAAGKFTKKIDDTVKVSASAPSLTKTETMPPQVKTEDERNHTLKVILIGASGSGKSSFHRCLKGKEHRKKRNESIDLSIYTWKPSSDNDCNNSDKIKSKFSVWDFKPSSDDLSSDDDSSACPGRHHATQSLFFTSNSLFLLFWDLGVKNRKSWRCGAFPKCAKHEEQKTYVSSSDEGNYFTVGTNHAQADCELENDIVKNVLFWVDCIRQLHLVNTIILPIASFDDEFDENEAKRRCEIMKKLLMKQCENTYSVKLGDVPNLMFDQGAGDGILRINATTTNGVKLLQKVICRISVGDRFCQGHLGTVVPRVSQKILAVLQKLKQEFKIVKVDHILTRVNLQIKSEVKLIELQDSLIYWSEIGEILYFGEPGHNVPNGNHNLLADFVVLCPKWFISAISCIVRKGLGDELRKLHTYQHQKSPFVSWWNDTSNCAAITPDDCVQLWRTMEFMRNLGLNVENTRDDRSHLEVFEFLQSLLARFNMLLPIAITADPTKAGNDDTSDFCHQDMIDNDHSLSARGSAETTFFLAPGIFPSKIPQDVWSYRHSDSWHMILSHSWLFKDTAPPGMIEQIFKSTIIDLSTSICASRCPSHRHNAQNMGGSGFSGTTCRHRYLRTAKCWKNAFFLEVGIRLESEKRHTQQSSVKIFVHLDDKKSDFCIRSSGMTQSMRRLTVSAKGLTSNSGTYIWKGGLEQVIQSTDHVIENTFGWTAIREIVCSQCLAEKSCKSACVWKKDYIKRCLKEGRLTVWCQDGHKVELSVICGKLPNGMHSNDRIIERNPSRRIQHCISSVVIVGLWDHNTKSLRSLGSGFVVDNNKGLIITAAHTLIEMEKTENFGEVHGRPRIGVIDSKTKEPFWYSAEIVVRNQDEVDACVLRITQESKCDFKSKRVGKLKIATDGCGNDENVWILGYSQKESPINIESPRGYVIRSFMNMQPERGRRSFQPRQEIVIVCPNATFGHSGGPCVNREGNVVGILSRGDPIDNKRFLVPSNQLKLLYKQATEQK